MYDFFQHGSPGKYILISPPHRTDGQSGSNMISPVAAYPSGGSSGGGAVGSAPLTPSHSMIKSPTRRVREGKKCRKVYGLEQRDLWCTQCKWKKACARFGSGAATAAASAGSTSSGSPATVHNPNTSAVNLSTSQPAAGSLLMAAPVNHSFLRAPAARAIKF